MELSLPVFLAEMMAPTSDPQLRQGGTDRQKWEIMHVLDKSEISKWKISCLNVVWKTGMKNPILGR